MEYRLKTKKKRLESASRAPREWGIASLPKFFSGEGRRAPKSLLID